MRKPRNLFERGNSFKRWKNQVLPFRWKATVEEEVCAETANENHIAQKSINH